MKCLAALCVVAGLVAFAEEPKNLLKPINKLETWRFEKHEGGDGTLKIDGDKVVLASTKVTGTDWHVQAILPNLDLKEGQTYVLKFKAKADRLCTIGVHAMLDEEDWHEIGLGEQIMLGKTAADHEFRFRAYSVSPRKKNRIALVLGHEECAVTIEAMTLVEK